jgi:hypothetical protein
VVNLPEDDPETFKIYVHLLYTGDLATDPVSKLGDNTSGGKLLGLAKLYVLAEKLQDIDAKNEALTALMLTARTLNTLLNESAVQTIYDGTPTESLARKAIVNMFAVWVGRLDPGHGFVSTVQNYPAEFTVDLLRHVLSKRTDWSPGGPLDHSKYMEMKSEKLPT